MGNILVLRRWVKPGEQPRIFNAEAQRRRGAEARRRGGAEKEREEGLAVR
jgi:hypothetical protein